MRSTAPIMSDREFLFKVENIFLKDGSGFVGVANSIVHPDVPLKKGVIRAEQYKGILA